MLRLHTTFLHILCHIFVKMHLYDFKLCQLFAHPKVIVTQNYWFKINCTFIDTCQCHTLSPNPMEWPTSQCLSAIPIPFTSYQNCPNILQHTIFRRTCIKAHVTWIILQLVEPYGWTHWCLSDNEGAVFMVRSADNLFCRLAQLKKSQISW